tara:strand:+ start:371 stop:586 length:216 start_codon:yes stop_codon:yes gene_type:complete
MNSLCIHSVNNIEISTKTLDNEQQSDIVNIRITQGDGLYFDLSLFMDDEKGFKALDMKALFDVIQKHTAIE